MWPTRNTLPSWWHHVMGVVLVSVVLLLTLRAYPGRASSTPAVPAPERGHVRVDAFRQWRGRLLRRDHLTGPRVHCWPHPAVGDFQKPLL
jgi:hypothetical protein